MSAGGGFFYEHRSFWTMSPALSFGNHLFHKAPRKSQLFPGSQVLCQNTEQGSAGLHCLCCCRSNYIYYGDSCQG